MGGRGGEQRGRGGRGGKRRGRKRGAGEDMNRSRVQPGETVSPPVAASADPGFEDQKRHRAERFGIPVVNASPPAAVPAAATAAAPAPQPQPPNGSNGGPADGVIKLTSSSGNDDAARRAKRAAKFGVPLTEPTPPPQPQPVFQPRAAASKPKGKRAGKRSPELTAWIDHLFRCKAMRARGRRLMKGNKLKMVEKSIQLGRFKVQTMDFKTNHGHGPDDRIYEQSFKTPRPSLNVWESQARGQTIIKVNGKVAHVLMGLRKFGYEEDAYTSDMSRDEVVTEETYTRKENGECFHLTGFECDGQFFWAGGSKNVHGVVRDDDDFYMQDLQAHSGGRYEYFKEMLTLWRETERRLKPIQRKCLRNFFKCTGFTLVGESCTLEHQHLVDYDKDSLFFFAATVPKHSDFGLTAMPPRLTRSFFNAMGLRMVTDMVTVRIDDPRRGQVRDKYRFQLNSEGAVVYVACENQTTGVTRVCRVYKYKNDDYVFRRAIREQMRKRAPSSKIIARIKKLHFRHTHHERMKKEGLQFNAWCRMRDARGDFPNWDWVFSHWVTVEKEFKEVPEETRASVLAAFNRKNNESGLGVAKPRATTEQIHMFAVGPPGTGKSTAWKVLEKVLNGFQRINQDEVGGKPGPYHNRIKSMTQDRTLNGILLDKCNHDTRVRGNTYNALEKRGKRVYVMFLHPGDDPDIPDLSRTATLAHQRIHQRGLAHTTLFPNHMLQGILDGFAQSWEALTEEEERDAALVMRVDMTLPIDGVIQTIIDELREAGLYTELAEHDSDRVINQAIKQVLADETTMNIEGAQGKATVYWSARLNEESYSELALHPSVRSLLQQMPTFKINKSFHSTLLFLGGSPPQGPEQTQIDSHYRGKEGHNMTLVSDCLYYNQKAVALKLNKNFPCGNKNAHITVALAPGVQASYSNQMLEDPQSTKYPCKVKLQAVLARMVSLPGGKGRGGGKGGGGKGGGGRGGRGGGRGGRGGRGKGKR